jgi:hypothetical protein
MALGSFNFGSAAYSAASGTTVSPAYPTGILSTSVVMLIVGMKPTAVGGGTVTTPSGWTLRESLVNAGGYTAQGADTGNTNLYIYTWDSPTAGQTGNLSVTLGDNNVSWAFISTLDAGYAAGISFGVADGQQTTTPTSSLSIALTDGASPTNFQAGDFVLWAMCIPTDVTTPNQFSTQTISATGATFFSPALEINEPDSANGNDIGGFSAITRVISGSSTTAPTITASVSGTLTNVRGPLALLRVRELAVTGNGAAAEAGGDTASASGTVTVGQITGSAALQEAGADTAASTGTALVQGSGGNESPGDFLGASRSGGGPDAEVSMADWLRRFGRVDLPPETVETVEVNDDEEAIALLLCALVQ